MIKKNLVMSIIGLFTFIFLAGGVSYAYFVYNKDIAIADLETGDISINFNSGSSNFTLANVQPMNDAMGKIYPEYMDFNVTGTADTEAILYEIEVVPKSGNTIDTKYVKFYLTDQNENVLLSPFTYDELYSSLKNNGKALYQDLVEGNIDGTSKTTTKNYRLRVWIDEKYDDITGGTFDFSVYLYAKNIDTTNLEKVTFDTQDGRNHGLVKYVIVGEDYGELPTPTREGYTFLGWNGKNMFNEEEYKLLLNNVTEYGDYYTFPIQYNGKLPQFSFENNKIYRITVKGYSVISDYWRQEGYNNTNFRYVFKYDDDTSYFNEYLPVNEVNTISYSSQIGKNVAALIRDYGYDGDAYIYYIQLEEGNNQTPYEPYYVTSDVMVTEWNTDMVLNAVWGWNNYKYNDEVQDIEIHGGTMHNDYISLNGTASDYIDLGEITDKKEVSIQATIEVNNDIYNFTNSDHTIVGNYEQGGFGIVLKNSKIEFTMYLDSTNVAKVVSNTTIQPSMLYNITATYDGAKMKIYINGELDSEEDITEIISNNNLNGRIKNPNNNTIMASGCNPSGNICDNSTKLKGDIYSVRIYDYAISEQKIKQNIKKDGFID